MEDLLNSENFPGKNKSSSHIWFLHALHKGLAVACDNLHRIGIKLGLSLKFRIALSTSEQDRLLQDGQCKRMQGGFLGTGLFIPLLSDFFVCSLLENFFNIM